MRRALVVVCVLAFFLAAGFYLEKSEFSSPLKHASRTRTIPQEKLKLRSVYIFKELGLLKAVADRGSKPAMSESSKPNAERTAVFSFSVNRGGEWRLPSSMAVDKSALKPGWPAVSVFTEEENLYGTERGIITHPLGKGRKWERFCYVSYFEGEELLFAASAGLRIHGGTSRSSSRPQSFRLYFRNEYGYNQIKPGLLFGLETEPLKRLVVHFDHPQRFPFTSCMAFAIARQIGGMAPETKPALFFLNGEPKGIYWLSEHQGRRQWTAHFGHKNFLFFVYRGDPDEDSLEEYRKLRSVTGGFDGTLTWDLANQYVDLDNLSRFIFSIVFCSTRDWNQGIAVRDQNDPNNRWFWVNWDMDKSFIYRNEEAEVGEIKAFELIDESTNELNIRALLFNRLMEESPEYRNFFVTLVMNVLNHRLTHDFLEQMVDHYRKLAISYGDDHAEWFQYLKKFFQLRSDFIRRQMNQYYQAGTSYRCTVKIPNGSRIKIDGFLHEKDFQGWYFEGSEIEVEIVAPKKAESYYWLVDGEKIKDLKLKYPIRSETHIEALFESD